MRKIRKRVFAAVLAAALLFTMTGMASYAVAEEAQTEEISESITEQAEEDATEELDDTVITEPEEDDGGTDELKTESGDTEETTEEDADLSGCNGEEQENVSEKDVEYDDADTEKCTCGTLCTEDSINGDCPVCGVEDADLSCCKGEKTENSSEENTEQADTGAEDASINLCDHHKEHTQDCGYSRASEDGEGSPCTYECRICPIEDLIAALPDEVTEGNAEKVRVQLDKILDLYGKLTTEEQEQIDLMRCYELQEAFDAANVPIPLVEGTPEIELFGQKVFSGDSGDGWSYADGVLTLNNYHADDSSEHFIHFINPDLNFTLKLTGDNSIKTSATLFYGHLPAGSTTIMGESGASLFLDGKNWNDTHVIFRDVNVDVTTQGMIFLSYDMVIDNATVNFNMNGSNGYIYTTHGGLTVQNGSKVTVTNSSGEVSYCVATNGIEITGSTLNITNPSGFGVYVTAISSQVPEHKAVITNSTISSDVLIAGIHCEDEASITNSQVTNSGQFLICSKKAITVDGSSSMKGITCEYFNSGTGTAYQVYGDSTLAANLTVASDGSFVIPEGATLTIPAGTSLANNGTMRIHDKASLTGAGSLAGGGDFLIDVSEEMICGTENLVYNGADQTEKITLEGNVTICGVEFTADTTGWTMSIDPAEVKEAGNYTVTLKKEGSTDITKTFTVAACFHTGLAYKPLADEKHGGTCPDCGEEVSEEHTWEDGVCSVCNSKAVAQVEIGNAITYYSGIDTAWTAAKGSTSTVTLLDHVTASGTLTVDNGGTVTFDGGNYTLTSGQQTVIEVNGTLKLVSGTVHSTFTASNACYGIDVRGMLEMTGGAVTMDQEFYSSAVSTYGSGSEATISGGELFGVWGVSVVGGSTVTIKNGKISGDFAVNVKAGTAVIEGGTFTGSVYGLYVQTDGTAVLRGGTFTGKDNAVSSSTVSTLLDKTNQQSTYYAYFTGGQPVNLNTLADAKSLPGGTYAVQECKHDTSVCEYRHNDGTEKHTMTCLACGYTGTPESCDYSNSEYQHDDIDHWQTCTVCGYKNKETHTLKLAVQANGTAITASDACDCSYQKDLGTVTLTVPASLTYHDGQTIAWTASEGLSLSFKWDASGDGFADQPISAAGLDAGAHTLYIAVSHDSQTASSSIPVTVKPATLTEAMVTVAPESVTYSGTEQKPTITVKQGDTTLVKGTDYDVTYSTTDFTNVGTITVTITGKGNYTGTVEKTYTIKKAPLTITASSQTITYGGSISQGAGNVSAAGLCSGDRLDGITLTASTANVPGGNITPSAAGIKNSGGRDVTGNYEITYKDGRLTINKADAEITVGTGTYSKTFGDAAFTLDVTDNNTEADVQYEVTAGADVISVSNGTVTIKNAGTATITVSLPASTNYNAAASKTITVNVAQKGGYTVAEQNRSYLYSRENTGSIDLAALLPKDCGTVTYGTPAASGDVTYSVAPAVNDGKLSYTLNSGNINDEGTITVPVATRNYTDITVTVKVKLTDQIPVGLKDGTEVTLINNTLTYGEPLSKLVFNKAEFVGDDGNTVAGTLAWKDAAATPDAGTTSAVWVFTPTDTAYVKAEGTAVIMVNKAAPTVSKTPALTDRVYNPSRVLEQGDLSDITVTGVDGKTLEGEWNWQSANIVPTVNNSGYAAVFTPKDTTNYGTVTRTVTVNVTKATPYIAGLPAAAGITYGDTLNVSALSGGTVLHGDGAGQAGNGVGSTETVAGAFTWKEPSAKPVAADSNATEYTIVFTPSDTANYNSVEAAVKLTVNKAQNAPNMPASAMSVPNSIGKVGSVPLPTGWEWQESDKDTALEVEVPTEAVAVYTGADKGNYENETVTVSITRSSCDHVAVDILYTGEGEKEPTCTEDGLGHKECTKCGTVVESGIVVKAQGHTGGTATCSRKAVCTRCNQSYGDTDSSRHGSTEVRGFVAATCTAGGYTGDTCCKDCGAKIKAGNATPALGHDYKSEVTKEATTESEGIRTYTCTRCGHSYTRPIAKLPGDTKPDSSQSGDTKPGSSQPGDTEPDGSQPGDRKPGSSQSKDRKPGSGSTEETRPEPGVPFIKGEDGKNGWDVIRAEEEQAKEGSVINVDMNGTTVVPGDIFDSIKGRDITITFDMGNGTIWSVDGKSITTDKAGDIDFSVKTGENAIPVDVVNNVTGESYSIQISLVYEGEFGFTALLSIDLGKENAGYTASLYYYNESTGELEFICADTVAEDGTASFAFTHASDYVIVVDEDEEESGTVTEPAEPGGQDEDHTGAAEESPQAGQPGRPWWFVVVGILAVVAGAGVFFVVRKKRDAD